MSVKAAYPPFVKHQYPVGVLYAGNTLGDYKLSGIGYMFGKSFSDFAVGGGIHRAGGIVQDKYFRLFQKSAGYAQR